MTISELKALGLFNLGNYFECVEALSDVLTKGEVYEVVLNRYNNLALQSNTSIPNIESVSKFVLVDPFMEDRAEANWNASDTDFDDQQILTDAVTSDIVVRPTHYTKWSIEPITFIMRNGLPFWKGNIIKYSVRAGSKIYDGQDEVQSEVTDLRKVIRYAEMRINQLNGEVTL